MERRVMRIERFGPPEVLRLEREELSAPADDEVLVAVDAAGVNFADTMVRRGEYRRDQPLSFTPGFEVAGRVVAAGAQCALEPGTPVAGFCEYGGGYADHVILPASRVYAVPRDLSPEQVAGVFLQGVNAWYAVHRYGRTRPGDWVLVHAGAGGLGGLAIQLARLTRARVIGTASTERKRRIAREHGAEVTVPSDPDGLAVKLREVTGRHGCDVIVDGVGGPLFEPSFAALARGGRYVVAGSASQQPAMLDTRRLMPRAQTVAGFVMARVADESPAEPAAALGELCELVRSARLKLALTVMGLEDAAAAHELIEKRLHTGKIVLRPER